MTSRRVERISGAGVAMVLPYFTKEMITPDNRGVLVTCRDADGKRWWPCIIEPEAKTIRHVGDVPCYNEHNPAIGGDRVVYITNDRRLGYAPISGGPFVPVLQLERADDIELSEVAASACGRYAVTCYSEKFQPVVKRVANGAFPCAGSERWWFGTRWVILHIDLETGIAKAVAGEHRQGGHPIISPADPFVVEWCYFAPWDQSQRMHAIRYFPAANVVESKELFPQRLGLDAVGHEMFLADGRIAFIYMRYDAVDHRAAEPAESAIGIVDPISGESRAYRTPGLVFNHLHGRDARTFVSEGRLDLHAPGASSSAGKSDGSNPLDLLCRYDVEDDHTIATPLCVTGCSWRGQLGHPHAILCRENRWCYFNSDRDGTPGVYRVRMD